MTPLSNEKTYALTTDTKKDSQAPTGESPGHVLVAVNAPLNRLLSYRVPRGLSPPPEIGQQVVVPLGKRRSMGYIAGISADPPPENCREILQLGEEVLTRGSVELLAWAARYYRYPPGEAVKLALTGGRARGGLRYRITERGKEALSQGGGLLQVQGLELRKEERAVLSRLGKATRPLTRSFLLRDTKAAPRTLTTLTRRNLITSETGRAPQPETRKETLVTVARTIDEADAHRLSRRSPKMWALYKQTLDREGPLALSKLREVDKGARQRVKRLEERGLLATVEVEKPRDPLSRIDGVPCPEVELTEAQRQVVGSLLEALHRREFSPFLLHGVTGSGKTEVYLHLIGEALKKGHTALTLVPEIALTPQLAGRFHSRFPGRVAVLHSGLTQAEKRDSWAAIKAGRLDIVVGARSALFAPLENIGVLVVDEEHDGSFKQQEGLRYQARDLAVVRAQKEHAVVVLGSATPSMESYKNAWEGRYSLLELKDRATRRPLPQVEVVDLKRYNALHGALTAPMIKALGETLERGQQAILFLNRRGFAPYLICRGCGEAAPCPNCSVSLTWHKRHNKAVCHYCGHSVPTPKVCPSCGTPEPKPIGLGTEQLGQVVREQFPQATIARLDRDSSGFGRMTQVLSAFREKKIDILVGTQMVTKGHDFPGVTLVGVILADHGLNFPDFRSAERTFQLLCQVAGRAGRGEEPGKVLVQTYNPTHHSIVCAQSHDYRGFFEQELRLRSRLGYPPSGHLVAVRFQGDDAKEVVELATEVARTARKGWENKGIEVLGPSEAPLSKLRGKTRWHLLLKSMKRSPLQELTAQLTQLIPSSSSEVLMSIDVDPLDMM